MKILVLESNSKRPLANTKIQLQVKGKDSGFLTLTTDANGNLMLDNKYNGQQLLATNGAASPQQPQQQTQQGQWTTASEGARLFISMSPSKQKETSHGGSSK